MSAGTTLAPGALRRGQQYVSDVDRPDRKKGGAWTYDGPADNEGLYRFTRDGEVFVFSGDGWLPGERA